MPELIGMLRGEDWNVRYMGLEVLITLVEHG